MLKIVNRIPAIPLIVEKMGEPLHNHDQVRVYSLLRPWHPLFKFTLVNEDASGQIVFKIELKSIFANGKSTGDEFAGQMMLGSFPWASYTDPEERQTEFAANLFTCLQAFLFECVAYRESKTLKSFPLITGGLPNWPMVTEYLKLATNPLSPWFDRATSIQNGKLHFVLTQTKTGWLESGQRSLEVNPVDLFGVSVAEIEAECAEAPEKADAMLKQYLKDRVTNALYGLRYKV